METFKIICKNCHSLKQESTSKSRGTSDVASCEVCMPWIFFINGVICFLKLNGSGMEKEER